MDTGAGGPDIQVHASRGEGLGYRMRRLAALFVRARASVRRRGLLPTLRAAWRRLRLPGAGAGAARPLALYADLDLHDDPGLPAPVAAPRASIVVPVHGQLALTRRCLQALARSGDAASFEVIVVDDASPDDTPRSLPTIPHLEFLRLEPNQGFIAACNAGAAQARGEFVVLLNNDTIPQPGWLDALLATFATHADTGLAGSMLLAADGRLQEAGGIVHDDGGAANYGRGEDAGDPRFGYVREADYVSGAALALPRALWRQLGGLDAHYAPAYYEDTDLAMRVRAVGLKVRYQPASRVVHLEGASAGTDTSRGMKAWQPVNERRFAQRWAGELVRQPSPRLPPERAVNHRAKARLLFVDEQAPTPDRDSGSVRIVGVMRALLAEHAAVDFAALAMRHEGARTEALQQAGVCAWWRADGDFAAWLGEHGRDYDAIVVSRHHVLAPLLPLLRRLAPQAELVFDSVDLHFLREEREAQGRQDGAALRAAARTREAELALAAAADRTWVVSDRELALLAELAPDARVDLVSNVFEVDEGTPGIEGRADAIFVGGFAHAPNVDAVRWLAAEIWPHVRASLPDSRLHLVGAEPPEAVRALAAVPGIVVHGQVADLDALLDRCRVSVAPLRFGAGVKGKVNQALARGLPVVVSECAAEGMRLVDLEDAWIAESAIDFAEGILRLSRDDALWQQLRGNGFANARRHFSPEALRAALRPWLQSLRAR